MDFSKLKQHVITGFQLQPHLYSRIKGMARSSHVIEVENQVIEQDISVTLGEPVSKGNAIYPAADSKYYKATNLNVPARAANLITLEDGVLDQAIKATGIKRITVSGAVFTVGAYVWLSDGSLSINVTTVLEVIAQGDIVQCLGKADSATTFIPNINFPDVYFY